MNLRFWGGWFLAIAGISILLTMGCEKGALGVKPATIVGQIVDKDNPTIPVANAVVRMISKEAVGTSELVQGNNFVSAVTGADGKFVFESVQADNVVFEYSAPGYASMIYPKTTSGDNEAEGSTAQIEFVSVRSGAFVDLRMLPLEKISNPLPATIKAKIDLVDKTTQQSILFNPNGEHVRFAISFNGITYTKSAQMWREEGVTLSSSSSIKTVVRNEATNSASTAYKSRDDVTIDGSNDVFQRIELDPVTYQLSLRCLNVPDYMVGSQAVINVFAEIPATFTAGIQKPAQIIKSLVMSNFGDMYVLDLPGLALQSSDGVHLRVQVRGYEDQVVLFRTNTLPSGTQGNYRLDIDMVLDDKAKEVPLDANNTMGLIFDIASGITKVGLFDNIKRRDIQIIVTNLESGNRVDSMAISLPHLTGPDYNPVNRIANNGPVTVSFGGVAVGYNMSYALAVTVATQSFSISKSNLVVNPENEPTPSTLVFAVNWAVEYNKLLNAPAE